MLPGHVAGYLKNWYLALLKMRPCRNSWENDSENSCKFLPPVAVQIGGAVIKELLERGSERERAPYSGEPGI
jgi:hypothetical protein